MIEPSLLNIWRGFDSEHAVERAVVISTSASNSCSVRRSVNCDNWITMINERNFTTVHLKYYNDFCHQIQ